jgi:hypothetical protein
MAWHDGLDTQSLASLAGEEREEAERLLTEALDSGDYRPAAGLAALRSKNAAAKLKKQLPEVVGSQRIETARALWQIEKYPPAVDALLDELERGAFWGERLDASKYLRDMKTPRVVAALWRALDDPEGLVRHHAAVSLLVMYGLQAEDEWDDQQLTIDIMSDEKEKQEEAVAALRKWVEEKGKIVMDGGGE